ncbi:hypothetical protein OEZ85_006481 [Tetradesmus obliquus]|uniref:Kinesin motor domain-containing protein n=1 Tax=Tetradesmus obliquus TaxID=3088 RepID=A0ABY8TUU5_TETOB|nr:hypothetical protein OEZ85_006481 [Tetradesmus obliquus]
MSDIWTKALRGGGPSASNTPRAKSYSNNRYGSKPGEEEQDSADSGQKRTPRQGAMYDRPWKDLASLSSAGRGTPRSRSYAARPPIPRGNSNVDHDDAASVAESDDMSVATEDDYREGGAEGESVQVFVRVRPINSAESSEGEHYNCTRIYGDRTVSVELKHRPEPYQFKFDCVLPENTSQLEIFERAGKPIVDNCMGGYNSTIFAYGQTGAGKTYTMQGPMAALEDCEERGLAPRVFEYLFSEIDKAQDELCHENLTFCVKVSMLEIYNEVITDLLNPSGSNLQIREDIKRGCYVEDLSEQLIQNAPDAMRLMRTGAENRHVGETRLNRESSRSHSVFACTLERHSKSQDTGVTNVLFSRLNLIDLAGSERIHGGEHGGSQATGKHFKEACHINKSLTTLGRVIMELVEAQRSSSGGRGSSAGGGKGFGNGKTRHVPYRDSRLTFLLQDSLGGNAKTLMIANISPSSVSAQETLSTLQFMSRAKCIRNRATINMDARGDVVLLQREIVRLNSELDNLRKGYTEPAIQEAKELRIKLDEMCCDKNKMDAVMLNLEKENQNLKSERRRLDHKMSQIQKGAGQLDQAIFSLTTKVLHHESLAAAATEKSLAAAKVEHEVQLLEMQTQMQQQEQQVEELQEELEQERSGRKEAEVRLQEELRDSVAAAAEQQQLEAATAEGASLRQQLQETTAGASKLQQQLQEADSSSTSLQQQLDAACEARDEAQEALEVSKNVNAGLDDQIRQLMERIEQMATQLQDKDEQLSASNQALAETRETLGSTQADLAAAQQQLTAEQQEAAAQVSSAGSERQKLQQLLQETEQQLQQEQEQLQQVQGHLQQTEEQLGKATESNEEAKQQIAELESKAAALQQQVQELESRNTNTNSTNEELQQQLAALQQQLQDAAAASAADKEEHDAQVQQLQQQLEAAQGQVSQQGSQAAALEEALSELNAAVKEKSQALEGSQEHCKQLQQQLEASTAAATAKADQLSSDLAAVRESSKSRQEELMKQVTEVHLQLSAAQGEQDRLQDDLDAARSEKGLLEGQLADARSQVDKLQAQASSKALECDLLRKKLSAAESGVSALKGDLADRDAEMDALRQAVKDAEVTASEEQEKAAEELNCLKRELMDAQELLSSRGFEVVQMQRRLEELAHRLTEKNASLDGHKEEVKGLKSTIAKMESMARQKEALLADKTALADQLQADNEALNAKLQQTQEELAVKEGQLRCKLNAHELQLKEQIVYNARNRQAMNEIRKVINWAQQPPATSAANTPTGHQARQRQQQQPFSPSVAGEMSLAAEDTFVEDGFGTALFGGNSGGSRSKGAAAAGAGLPGPQSDGLPLMLEDVQLSIPASQLSAAAARRRSSDSAGSGRGSVGDGDGMVSVTAGSGGSRAGRRHGSGKGSGKGSSSKTDKQWAPPEVDVSLSASGVHEAQEGSCYQDTQQLYSDGSRADIGSDCSRALLVPEQASSPVRMSAEDSLGQLHSPQRSSRGSAGRSSRRDTSRRALRAGFEHLSCSTGKKHSMMMSGDASVVLSVSAEWSASSGHEQHDMRLPAAVVGGDCDVEQDT